MQTKLALQDEVYSSRCARETPMALSAADIHVPRTCLIIPGQGSGDSGWPFQGVVIQ